MLPCLPCDITCCLLISVTTGKLFLQEFRMRKLFFFLLTIIGVVLFIAGLPALFLFIFSPDSRASVGVAVMAVATIAGGGMVYWGYRGDQKREKTEEQKQHERITSLTKKPWSSHQVLKIRASAGWYLALIFLGCLFFILPVIIIFHELPKARWDILALCAFMLCLGVPLLAQQIPFIGKPLVELTTQGIKTPLYGMISWSDIEGIHLHITSSQRGEFYTLILKTNERLKKDHFHWASKRIFSLFFHPRFSSREMIYVRLPSSREPPKAIEAVARFLWTQATGLSHHWSPVMRSEEINQLRRKIREAEAQRRLPDFSFIAGSKTMNEEELAQEIRASYKSGDPGALKLARTANEQLQRSEQIMRDREKLAKLLNREFKKKMWKIGALIFSIVILVFIRFKYFG